MSKKYDYSISLIRVMAMFFIILCHLSSHYNIGFAAQFFNVGVPIFFMISGYLYGDKRIDEPISWLYKRYSRLVIPAIIWLVLNVITNLFHNPYIPSQQEVLMLLLNLHGINFVFTKMPDLGPGPWFFSSIMCCYILLLLFLSVEKKHSGIYKLFNHGGVYPLLIFTVLALLGISTDGALAFFIGFVLKRKGIFEQQYWKININAILCFVLSVSVRYISKLILDETTIYNEVIAPICHVILALSFLNGVKWLFSVCPSAMDKTTNNKFFHHLDRISIYVYVCHDQLFGVLDWGLPLPVLMVMYFAIVLLVSTIAWAAGEFVTSNTDKLVKYCFG